VTRIIGLIVMVLLSGCAGLFPPPPPEAPITNQLLQGIHELHQQNSSRTLDALIQEHPKSSEARAAREVLRLHAGSDAPVTPGSSGDLEKLREENSRLQNDLEQLRKLLIQSEKSDS